jgi:uroporphyrin-III C-methyltransferase
MQQGKVIFVGAGPGDPELLTLKAVRHLGRAEVILIDRLANAETVSMFAPKAQIIAVGKQSRHCNSTPQSSINALLVEHALAGKYVVRLKGGDVSIFSNILDELQAIQAQDIPYELVPGITAAIGTAAYAGVPLTARGVSNGVRMITYHNERSITDSAWHDLASTADTLVFYMSGAGCFSLVKKLLQFGKAPNTPILLAEQATTPLQRFSLSNLGTCEQDWQAAQFLSPTLIVVGLAAALHKQFAWGHATTEREHFFEPISPLCVTDQPKHKSNVTTQN